MKKLLILGGTNFIGRNLVESLVAKSEYEICLLNRQQSNAQLFPELAKIKADRLKEDLGEITQTNWDAVIDLSCYFPKALASVLGQLKGHEHYIFISTCSVYENSNLKLRFRNEEAPILSCSSEQATDSAPQSYGARKAECERMLKHSGHPYTIFRPALVFGPHDPTDRLYYWLYQVKKTEQLLMPEAGERIFSITYVADLVRVIQEALHRKPSKETYNAISKPDTSIKEIVGHSINLIGSSPKLVNASAEFLKEQKIREWLDMPLWINGDHFTYSNQKLESDFNFPLTDLPLALAHTMSYFEYKNWPKPHYGIDNKTKEEILNALSSS